MIGAIENAIIARLQAASDGDVLGYTFRTLETYGGQFDEQRLAELVQFPAAYVVFLGDRHMAEYGAADEYKATFAVILASTNYRNEQAARHGAAGDVGTYQLIADARALLKRKSFGLEIGGLEPGPARSLFSGQIKQRRASVYAVEFTTTYSDAADIEAEISGLDDFKTFYAAWDVPPIGNVGAPPDPENPDAEDIIELEGAGDGPADEEDN